MAMILQDVNRTRAQRELKNLANLNFAIQKIKQGIGVQEDETTIKECRTFFPFLGKADFIPPLAGERCSRKELGRKSAEQEDPRR